MRRRYRLAIGVSLGMAALGLATRDVAQSAESTPEAKPQSTPDPTHSPAHPAPTFVAGLASTLEPSPRGP